MAKKASRAPVAGVNIKQVAAAAGVSVATISRALKEPHRLKPSRLKQVKAIIDEMGYVPNAQARGLRTSRSGLIIALVPDIASQVYGAMIRGVERIAIENGYNVLVGDTQNDVSRERDFGRLIASRQADGLIAFLPRVPEIEYPGRLPIVSASSYTEDDKITKVHVDNLSAASEATNVLIAMGHRNIGLIRGSFVSPVFSDREAGYRAALKKAGISGRDDWVVLGDLSVEAGMAATELLFSRDPDITAIFSTNDEMALGAIKALHRMGLRVPEDVSVIGFNDTPLSSYFDPPLSTVAQPSMQIGEEAMKMLLEILDDPSTPPRRRILNAQLVMRGSTGVNRRGTGATGQPVSIVKETAVGVGP